MSAAVQRSGAALRWPKIRSQFGPASFARLTGPAAAAGRGRAARGSNLTKFLARRILVKYWSNIADGSGRAGEPYPFATSTEIIPSFGIAAAPGVPRRLQARSAGRPAGCVLLEGRQKKGLCIYIQYFD